ncbi:hypothetical protein pipiens_016358, partial [Culex pipiens pipiens]
NKELLEKQKASCIEAAIAERKNADRGTSVPAAIGETSHRFHSTTDKILASR